MPEQANEAGTPTAAASSGRRWLALLAGTLGGAAMVLLLLVTVYGARLDAATVALAAAAAALIHALGRLYAVARALAAPDRMAAVGRGAGSFTQAELRDEKRRLLRAIKELEFDRGMDKLSQQDFDAVISTYRLRAIEVMRALEGGTEVHPELARLLKEREGGAASAEVRVEVKVKEVEPVLGPLDVTTRICVQCSGGNDTDAKFCKHCGAPMRRERSAPQGMAQAAVSGEIGGTK
ncbi:MAG: zinc ribbon domain-containing protein [Myxococcales bacterium]|nr:zinc ribbon domain-containing protein [Myxococcales bacterium]